MDIKNKTVLITGGAVRIGRTISLKMARIGAQVFCHFNKSVKEAHSLKEEEFREVHEKIFEKLYSRLNALFEMEDMTLSNRLDMQLKLHASIRERVESSRRRILGTNFQPRSLKELRVLSSLDEFQVYSSLNSYSQYPEVTSLMEEITRTSDEIAKINQRIKMAQSLPAIN